MKRTQKVLVSLSGGMDSATLLGIACQNYEDVEAVGFTYGSKHNEWENECAIQLANYYQVPFDLIDLSEVMKGFKSNLLKSGGEIPEGHYEHESMALTVVPARNMIFLSILSGLAVSRDIRQIWIGVHKGDHPVYADCRPEFINHMRRAMHEGTDGKVDLYAPFVCIDKKGILQQGLKIGVPYKITRTCYKDQPLACGKCGSCTERLEAFAFNKTPDPVEYETEDV